MRRRESLAEPFVVFGASGSGSVPIEAALSLLELPYRVEESAPGRDRRRRTDSLTSIPSAGSGPGAPDGRIDDRKCRDPDLAGRCLPERPAGAGVDRRKTAGVPAMDDVRVLGHLRPLLDRRQPGARHRTGRGPRGHQGAPVRPHRPLLGADGAQLQPGKYLLGEDLSVLDLYVATVSRWSPGRRRFYEVAPGLADIVRRVDADPRLATFWTQRFPFTQGWER